MWMMRALAILVAIHVLVLPRGVPAFAPSVTTPPVSVRIQGRRLGKNVRAQPCRKAVPPSADDQESKKPTDGPAVNLSLVRQTLLNQALIGFTIWTGGDGARVLQEKAHFDTEALALALAGVVPLIYLSRQVETSEDSALADLNVSTNMLVLRLFGGKPQPIVALVVSAVLAGVTGLVEETTFRGQVLGQLSYKMESLPVAVALSTVIFAVLHVNPIALFRGGKEGAKDAAVLIVYQLLTGTCFALLYVLTGNLAVSVLTHAFFDFYVFYGTHLIVTTQMDYARDQSLMPVATGSLESKWQKKRGDKFVLGARETFYLADSNRDGELSREELRIALYSYGIKLSEEQSVAVAQAADTDQSGTIDFGEFLDFVGPSGSPAKAIKSSLLGVN
mmetsp:Transcript_6077/g.11914  ORF Transcript_6077/g.11914 Transcript_6077/m.11914 type:complete len:390 (+) Transcript_6077:86-1255(+)